MSYPLQHGGDVHLRPENLVIEALRLGDLLLPKFAAMRQNQPPPVVAELSFRDVVEYFTMRHPGTASIRSGALLRQPHPRGHLVFQVFLGPQDELGVDPAGMPYGRELIARTLDVELSARFAHTDLLIFR